MEDMGNYKKTWIKIASGTTGYGKNYAKHNKKDRKINDWVRKQTGVTDILERDKKLNLKLAWHFTRMKDDRWTLRVTEWYPRDGGTKHRGKHSTRWRDKIEWLARNSWLATAKDREAWRKLEEAFILQWMRNGWWWWL